MNRLGNLLGAARLQVVNYYTFHDSVFSLSGSQLFPGPYGDVYTAYYVDGIIGNLPRSDKSLAMSANPNSTSFSAVGSPDSLSQPLVS